MRMTPNLSTRNRVVVRILALLVVVWALGGWLLVATVEQRIVSDLDADLEVSAVRGAALLDSVPASSLAEIADSLRVAGSDSALLILAADGGMTAVPSGPSEQPDPLPDLAGRTVADLRERAGRPFTLDDVDNTDDLEYRVITVSLSDGGVVVVAKSMSSTENSVHQLERAVVLSLLVGLAAVTLLVWLISRLALRPLESVIDTAEQISASSLDTRVEVHNSAPDVERLANSMNTMLSRLEGAFDATERSEARLRQFVADASHELRTPLAAVIGYAELYEEQIASTPEQVDRIIRRIIYESNRMQSLVDDLLLLARLDEGRSLERRRLQIRPLLEEAVNAVRVVDTERSYDLHAAAGSADVLGDPIAIRQIFDNLLANVRDHTPPGTACRVELVSSPGEVIVLVVDDGPGVAADQSSRVFDRFWRAEPSRSRPGGNGLGLAIVADLLKSHGGSITLETDPTSGSTFTVRLPLLDGPQSQ